MGSVILSVKQSCYIRQRNCSREKILLNSTVVKHQHKMRGSSRRSATIHASRLHIFQGPKYNLACTSAFVDTPQTVS